MWSKAKVKLIRSLEMKKHRLEEGLFVAEGPKIVGELLGTFRPLWIAHTEEWTSPIPHEGKWEDLIITQEQLQQASLLRSPQGVIGVFHHPGVQAAAPKDRLIEGLVLALDGVQDPGNVGTLIRLADWFGIKEVIMSPDCADPFSPKVVQATMGSIARVNVVTAELSRYLSVLPDDVPIYGTLLDGEDLYSSTLSDRGVIVMGSEGNGISSAIRPLITSRLKIPSFPPDMPTAESLNVSVAGGIVLSEFRRRMLTDA